MEGPRGAWLLALLGAGLRLQVAGGVVYSKLEVNARCADYQVQDVADKELCFDDAAQAVGLGALEKMQIDGLGFNGCALNTVANMVIFSESPAVKPGAGISLPTLQYICNGQPTTTGTTTGGMRFVRLLGGERCHDRGVADILSKEACLEQAANSTGLGGLSTRELNSIGFSGCVFNNAANVVIFGQTAGIGTEANLQLPNLEYLCDGGFPAPPALSTTTPSEA